MSNVEFSLRYVFARLQKVFAVRIRVRLSHAREVFVLGLYEK